MRPSEPRVLGPLALDVVPERMNKLHYAIIFLSTLAFLGCATGDRVEIYETGKINLNKEEVSFEDLMTMVLKTEQLRGDTPVIYIGSDGGKRKSTVEEEAIKYIQAVNSYYFP